MKSFTVRISPATHKRAKSFCKKNGYVLQNWVDGLIRKELKQHAPTDLATYLNRIPLCDSQEGECD